MGGMGCAATSNVDSWRGVLTATPAGMPFGGALQADVQSSGQAMPVQAL
jgi:hypothetical protein